MESLRLEKTTTTIKSNHQPNPTVPTDYLTMQLPDNFLVHFWTCSAQVGSNPWK